MAAMNDVAIMPRRTARAGVGAVIVSDTHNVPIPVALFPPGDLLIHAGDHTRSGLPSELAGAAAWLRSLAARYTHGVVTIGGNHDRPLDTETWLRAAPHSRRATNPGRCRRTSTAASQPCPSRE